MKVAQPLFALGEIDLDLGRVTITDDDILMAAELALPHRLKRLPFQQSEITLNDLQDRLESVQSELPSDVAGDPEEQDTNPQQEKKKQ